MCYYSTTLRPHQFREAKPGEDLTLTQENSNGHHYPVGADNKIVCVAHGARVHFDKLELNPATACAVLRQWPSVKHYIGKPLTTVYSPSAHPHYPSYAADHVMVGGHPLHLIYLKAGTKMHLPLSLETKLGVDDPSIVHDHMALTDRVDEQPTLARALGRALGVCSITR
jgi:hypothetical protein